MQVDSSQQIPQRGEPHYLIRQCLIERPIFISSLAIIKILKSDTGPGTTTAENTKRLPHKYYVLIKTLMKAATGSRKHVSLFINFSSCNPVLYQLKVLSAL